MEIDVDGGLDRTAFRQVDRGCCLAVESEDGVVVRWRRSGRSKGWWEWKVGKVGGVFEMADGGREGGTRGEKWAAEGHGGGRETGQCRWGCHPGDQRAACKKVEQFCFVPNWPSGSRPQLSPGTSTCSPHRVVGNPQPPPVVCEYSVHWRAGSSFEPRTVSSGSVLESGVCALAISSQNAPLFRRASGAVQPLWRGAGQLSSQVLCKSTSTRKMRWGAKGRRRGAESSQLKLACRVPLLSPARDL